MISAILLAAGQSKRMLGINKLSKIFKGVPLINHSVKNILNSNIDELIIVIGFESEVIKKLIPKNDKIKFVFNKDFQEGMSSSIKIGLNRISSKAKFFFICLGDMPMIDEKIYNKIIKDGQNYNITAPIYKKKQGNPVFFSITMKSEIMKIKGDFGAKKILETNNKKVFNLNINDDAILKNYNTQENFNLDQ